MRDPTSQFSIMIVTDIILLILRWLHALAATAWVGGGLLYLLVLRPARQKGGEGSDSPFVRAASTEFSNLVDLCIITLLVTGIVLAATRLTTQSLGIPYIATLAAKILLALFMFGIVLARRRRRGVPNVISDMPPSLVQRMLSPFLGTNATVTIGLIVFLLADILRFLVERNLSES